MLHTPFKNYDEFKELFVRENTDGSKSRKNGILLSFYKSKAMREKFGNMIWEVDSMSTLFNVLDSQVRNCGEREVNDKWRRGEIEGRYCVTLLDGCYRSDTYETDGQNGICVEMSYKKDGTPDHSFYRYQNMKRDGQVFKMKVGKMYCHLMDMSDFGRSIPYAVRLWMAEEVTRRWEAFSASRIPSDLVLHIDDDFEGIYGFTNRCEGNFHSCMSNLGSYGNGTNWKFYQKSVKAKAAYLTRGEEGKIVARCVLFTEVTRHDTGEKIRIAERQYSTSTDELLQRILVQKLIDGGHIDAYKKPGAGCGDASAFVDKNGRSMSDVKLSIECHLEEGDHLSYQDSFKWYDEDGDVAYNKWPNYGYYDLETTSPYYKSDNGNDEEDDHDGQVYSNYHDVWIDDDDACWVETRDDYFYDDECVEAYVYDDSYGDYHSEMCLEDDCITDSDGDYYYAGAGACYPRRHGLVRCPYCGEWFAPGHSSESIYSEITDEDYCSEDCFENAEREYKAENWYYAEYDDDYFELRSEVTKWAKSFNKDTKDFEYETISYEKVRELVDDGDAVYDENSGMFYSNEALDVASEHAA